MMLPPWKHRRRLVYASWTLGAAMIVVGAAAAFTDYTVAVQMVVGGVAIVTVPLTAYVSFATLDDKWHFKDEDTNEPV